MSIQKKRSQKISGLENDPADQPEIFGRSKSRQEIKEETRAARKKEIAALREAHRRARAARKEAFAREKHTELMILSGFLGAIVLAAAVMLTVQIAKDKKQQPFEPQSGMSQYWNSGAQPELSEEGMTAVINRVYYTKGGYLCVHLTIGNGSAYSKRMTSLDVELRNGDTNAVIAAGYVDAIGDDYVVPAQDYREFRFRILPEDVVIKDDPLSVLSYSVWIADDSTETE